MRTLAALAFFAVSAAGTYRIDLKGGAAYWTSARPEIRAGRYVFRTREGTLMSVRESDVVRIGQERLPKDSRDAVDLGPTSPAAAARYQKIAGEQAREARRRPAGRLLRQDPYRPGVGLPYPPSANDYRVGKTFAYPPSGKVYEGLPPTMAPEGQPPELEPSPPPPPPKR